MGVKFAREYTDIITELVNAMQEIQDAYEFFEMNSQDWVDLNEEEQKECLKTLADDAFYGLGMQNSLKIGQGKIIHNRDKHLLEVFNGNKCVHIVNLI